MRKIACLSDDDRRELFRNTADKMGFIYCLKIEQSLQSHHTPISHIFKTLNPVESFSPLPLQYHITQLVFSAEYSYQST